MKVQEAILTRRSVRAFRPDPVPRATVERILELAARAPSGTNMQPWHAYVVTGAAKQAVTDAVLHERKTNPKLHLPEYRYYPEDWREPYVGRRRKVGYDLYALLGIEKGDKQAMHRQHGRNFEFFGAPVGLFFTVDRDLEIGSWLDYGMFVGTVMLAARGEGLHTCPQAAWPPYHRVIRKQLGFSDGEALICGMALGYEDETAPENKLRTERAPLADWVRFLE